MGDWDYSLSGSAGIYHYNHGTDQMFLGLENKFKTGNLGLGIFTGASNTSNNNPALLVDLKENFKYGGIFGNNIRIRNMFSDGTNTTQIRIAPVTLNIPLGKTCSAYLNPHYVGKYNYNTKEYADGIGAFSGLEFKISKGNTLDLEVQRYNIQDWNEHKGNWGVNVIYTKTL